MESHTSVARINTLDACICLRQQDSRWKYCIPCVSIWNDLSFLFVVMLQDGMMLSLLSPKVIHNFIALYFGRMHCFISKALKNYFISLYLYQVEGSNYPFLFLLCHISYQANLPCASSGHLSTSYLQWANDHASGLPVCAPHLPCNKAISWQENSTRKPLKN